RESVFNLAAYSISWAAFQPIARTEKLSRPSLILRPVPRLGWAWLIWPRARTLAAVADVLKKARRSIAEMVGCITKPCEGQCGFAKPFLAALLGPLFLTNVRPCHSRDGR